MGFLNQQTKNSWVNKHCYENYLTKTTGFPNGSDSKACACNAGDPGSIPGSGPWRRKWQPIPVLLPGKFHGRRSLVGYSPWGLRVGQDWATSLSLALSTRINSVVAAQLCPTLCSPTDRSTPGLPVLHHLPELAQTHVHWVGDAIQPSCSLSSPSPPAFNLSQHQGLFLMSWLFASGGQSIGASLSASVLAMNIQGWFPLGLTGWIFLQSKGLSGVLSNTTFI